ncbi:MAG TPA: DOMON domain-containing protein, partial [Spirochaetales bacterium]|nr:DOMON domain-containing protein [Spirochaetales bacterium]
DGRTLYAALEAPTTGWVSVGLGSLRMDGAFMVLGYDAAGTAAVSEETGSGRRHTPNPARILTAQAVRETAGKTVLEFALPAAPHAAGSSLKLILAYGRRDDFTSIHARYAPVEVPISR